MSERMSDADFARIVSDDFEHGPAEGLIYVAIEIRNALKAERERVAELEEEQVCLKTNIPAAHRLLAQRRTIKRLLERFETVEAENAELKRDLIAGVVGVDYLDLWIERRNHWQQKAEGFLASANSNRDQSAKQQDMRIALETRYAALREAALAAAKYWESDMWHNVTEIRTLTANLRAALEQTK